MIGRMLDRYVLACLILDAATIIGALALAEFLRAILPYGRQLADRAYITPAIYALVLGCWLISAFHFRLYEWRWTVSWRGELGRITTSVAGSSLLFAAALYLSFRDVPRLLFLYYAPLAYLAVLLTHLAVRGLTPALAREAAVRIAIVGTGRIAGVLADRLAQRSHPWPRTTIVGFIATHEATGPSAGQGEGLSFPILGGLGEFVPLLERHRITTVLLALPADAHATALHLSETLAHLAVDVRLLPDVLSLASARATVEYVEGLPLLGLRDPALSLPSRIIKYTFDRVVSALGLLLLWPLLALIVIAIRLDSPGPAIYRARRVGEGQRPFDMYKFRSMQLGADQRLGDALAEDDLERGIYKVPDDPRVTRVGRVLRRTSLDELPQLLNVLRGEMSIVGPRPEQPFIAAQYLSWQHKRTEIRPGLTGWWQVNGRSDKPLHQHTDFDIYYLENYSFWLDLRILGRTLNAVVRGRGAY